MAKRILGAKLVEIDSEDHLPFAEPAKRILDEIEEFLTGHKGTAMIDSVVSTVMFTDIVGSTERAQELGDRRWRDLLESHHATIRHEFDVHRGREIETTGDGFYAMFDGPARATRCGLAIRDAVQPLGISVRVGLHTGELILSGDEISGIAVHIAARVVALATAGQVLVSQTVKDLVAGSEIKFEDQGLHAFKGLEDEWRLYSVLED